MKKKNLIKKLQLKKSQVSNFQSNQVVGGSRYECGPIDLSAIETCYSDCDLTITCTQFRTCNNISFLNCTAYNCTGGTGGSGGSGGTGGNSGEPSCANFSC